MKFIQIIDQYKWIMSQYTQDLKPESNEPKSIQIVKILDSKFIFDFEALQNIINKNKICRNLPVAIIIINGAARTGKSFFCNFIVRYIKNKTLQDNQSNLEKYFTSCYGTKTTTLGIWALDEVFVYDKK